MECFGLKFFKLVYIEKDVVEIDLVLYVVSFSGVIIVFGLLDFFDIVF